MSEKPSSGRHERAIRPVARGEILPGPQVASRAIGFLTGSRAADTLAFPQLTAREREVLDLVARGLDNTGISRRLALCPKTVRNHLSNVFTKLQVADRSQAIVRSREANLGRTDRDAGTTSIPPSRRGVLSPR